VERIALNNKGIRGKGKRRRLLGAVLALMAMLAPDLSWSADLSVDGSLGNSPYTVESDLSYTNEYIGTTAAGGILNQSSSTNTLTTNLYLGQNAGSSGTYNLSGGSLSANGACIGFYGNGDFTQSAGSNTISQRLFVGTLSGSSGSYTLSGGSLAVGVYEYIGYSGTGTGTFTQSGGTHTLTGNLYLAYNAGNSGTYTQSGGTHTVTGTLYFCYLGGTGTYNLQAGSLTAGTVNLNTGGTFNQTGGSLNATTFNQQGGEVQGSLENRGTFNYYSGAFSGRLLNYGAVNFITDFTADDGLANYSATTLSIDAGRTVTLDGSGLDNQGTLVVNGTLANSILAGGPLVNNNTGTLSGTGTIQGDLTNQGTVSPGNSTGTLTITGNYTQAASGTLEVQIASPSSYSKLAVSGSASLNGALKMVLLNGFIPSYGQRFPGILTATGGVSGTFSSLVNKYITPTLYWNVLYSANSVDLNTELGELVVARDYTNPSLGLTPNQWQVGNMFNGLANTATGDLNDVLNAIDHLPTGAAVGNAFQQISADKVSSLPSLAFAGANLQWRGLANRITNLRYAGMGGSGGFGGRGSFGLNYSRLNGLMLAYNSSSLAGLLSAKKEPAPETRWGLYLNPGAVLGSQKSTINQTGYSFNIAGFTAGADYRVKDDLLVGLATGYSHTGAGFLGSGGSVETNTWPLMAYAAYLPQSFYAYGSLGYALNLFNLRRNIIFEGINRTAKSSTTGNQFNAYGEAGYDLKAGRLVVTPVATLSYSSLWVGGFTEKGAGALNLKTSSQQADSLQTGLGAKVAVPLKVNQTKVVPQCYATYQHEFSNNSRNVDARLNQGSSTFNFQTDQPQRDFAVVGGNVNLFLQNNLSAQIDYNTELGKSKSTAHFVSAALRWEF